jgi:vacuolar protein sorting-associated protein 13A/C
MHLTLSSRERLDLNLTTTFAELAITTLNTWAKQGEYVLQKARGSYAPYRISNRTGSPVFLWPDIDGSTSAKDVAAVKIPNDETVDWRFDDWKTMREVFSIAPPVTRILTFHKSACSLFWAAQRGTSI